MKKILSIALLGALVAIMGWQFFSKNTAETVKAEVGHTAPDFTVTDIHSGKKVKLSDYRGKRVILNFWASWCPPCREEMPDMEAFHQEFGNDVHILAVNATDQDDEGAAKAFLIEMGLTFEVGLDAKGDATSKYEIDRLPTSFFIDEEGVIKKKQIGAITPEQMESFVK